MTCKPLLLLSYPSLSIPLYIQTPGNQLQGGDAGGEQGGASAGGHADRGPAATAFESNVLLMCLPSRHRVETLEGNKAVRVREGTQTGDRLRLRGLGFPRLGGYQRGDQFVVIRCVSLGWHEQLCPLQESFTCLGSHRRSGQLVAVRDAPAPHRCSCAVHLTLIPGLLCETHGLGRGVHHAASTAGFRLLLRRGASCCYRVVTPRNLTQRQRELLEEFAAAGQEGERAKAA